MPRRGLGRDHDILTENADSSALLAEADRLWLTGEPEERARAAELYARSLETGRAKVPLFRLGIALREGWGQPTDLQRAMACFADPLLADWPPALFQHARALLELGGEDNAKRAMGLLDRAAALGHAGAETLAAKERARRSCPFCQASGIDGPDPQRACHACGATPLERVLAGLYPEPLAFSLDLSSSTLRRADGTPVSAALMDRIAATPGVSIVHLCETCGDDVTLPDLASGDAWLCLADRLDEHDLAQRAGASGLAWQYHRARDAYAAQDRALLVARKPHALSAAERSRLGETAEALAVRERPIDLARTNSFWRARAADPDLRFSDHSLRLLSSRIDEGFQHTTLGLHAPQAAWESARRTAANYVATLRIAPSDRVVEYGCGSLRVGVNLIEYLESGNYFGLDVIEDFYAAGLEMIDPAVVARKSPRLRPLAASSLAEAAAFAPRHIVAAAVIFHIHPTEIVESLANLARLAHRPGAQIMCSVHLRNDGEAGFSRETEEWVRWRYPLWFLRDALNPLELVGIGDKRPIAKDPDAFLTNLVFRRPFDRPGDNSESGSHKN